MRNLIAFIFFLVGINNVFSQQNPISNFYQFNEYLLNPAEAGSQNKLEGTLSHRLQWRGIQGTPETSFLGIHTALNKNMGIGGKLSIDKSDILQQFSGAISYSYHIELGETKRIHFGVSAMGMQNNIRFGDIKVTDQSDELINNSGVEAFSFDAEAGITLEVNQLRIGFSSAHLFESGVNFDLPTSKGTFDRARSFNSYLSYSLDLNPDWKIEPMIMSRNQRVKSFQLEFNALFSWQEKLFLGAGYRDQAGFITKAGFQITDHLLIAYAYEFSNTGIASYSNGSHEFMLGYRLKHSKKKEREIKEEFLSPTVSEEKQEQIEEKKQKEDTTEEFQAQEGFEETTVAIEELLDTSKNETALVKETLIEEPTIQAKAIDEASHEPNQTVGLPIFDEIIYFKFQKAELSDEGKKYLQNIVKKLNESSNIKLTIIGHTCDLGDNSINQIVSLARANAVKDYLISRSIKEERLIVIAMLDKEPAVPNDTFNHRKKNRRVEFKLINSN
ncbi:MAG: PorP/SprF family type IX secretion system membrane protein [Flavobacteriales bacterium]|nr:PorP/SprF family type IX secretion system membrane protein [Flavobacteriales bacterium]